MFIERSRCPACHSGSHERLLSVPFDDPSLGGFVAAYYRIDPARLTAPYRLDRCRSCGLIFQRFVGDETLLADLYGKWAPTVERLEDIPEFNTDLANPRTSRDGHELMTASAFLGRPIRDLTVLDYGMGWGLWATIARRLGASSCGTELSEKMAADARRRGVELLDKVQGEFDFVNVEQVIEHVTEPLDLLAELTAVLSRDGIIKLSLPNASNAPRIIAAIKSGRYAGDSETIMPIQPLEHINAFSPAVVRRMAAEAGLEIVRPKLAQLYAFMRRGGLPSHPKKAIKELIRPFWQYHNRRNIYVWLRRPPP